MNIERSYEGAANFGITTYRSKQGKCLSVELHVPGFFLWKLPPDRARDLATELAFAATNTSPEMCKDA